MTNKAIDILINKILSAVNCSIEKLNYDKTFKATIWKANVDGTYSINYRGQLYDIPNSLNATLYIGQNVWVKIPSGIFREMHICGVVNK